MIDLIFMFKYTENRKAAFNFLLFCTYFFKKVTLLDSDTVLVTSYLSYGHIFIKLVYLGQYYYLIHIVNITFMSFSFPPKAT